MLVAVQKDVDQRHKNLGPSKSAFDGSDLLLFLSTLSLTHCRNRNTDDSHFVLVSHILLFIILRLGKIDYCISSQFKSAEAVSYAGTADNETYRMAKLPKTLLILTTMSITQQYSTEAGKNYTRYN